jgi:hypothetical protein
MLFGGNAVCLILRAMDEKDSAGADSKQLQMANVVGDNATVSAGGGRVRYVPVCERIAEVIVKPSSGFRRGTTGKTTSGSAVDFILRLVLAAAARSCGKGIRTVENVACESKSPDAATDKSVCFNDTAKLRTSE